MKGEMMIKNAIGQMGTTVKELIYGILIFGVLIWLVLICFVSDKGGFTLGLLIGMALSVFQAIHMNYSIGQSLELSEHDAKGYMVKMTALRMGIVLVIFVAACLIKPGNPLGTFAGLFTLKFGAYFQPVLHRLIHRKEKTEGR